MCRPKTRKLSFQSLEHRALLAANPLETNVQLVQHNETGGNWYVGGTRQFVESHDIAERWQPVLAEDFTADGIADVLGKVDDEWWLQISDGTQTFSVPWGDTADGIDILGTGDFNDDGWLDVLSREVATGDLLVAENSENGFNTQRWGGWTTSVPWSHIAVRDFDNDGRLDVLASEPGGTWWLAKNHGSGFHNYRWGRFQDHGWQNVVAGDFNGDQLGDVAARGQDNTWWVWFGTDAGLEFAQYWGHWKMGDDWQDIGVADFNSDGRDDIIGRKTDGTLWVASAAETEFFTWAWGDGWVNSAEWSDVELIDVDEDGNVDQVGRANDGTFWLAKNTGTKLQNYFWGRSEGTPEFVDYVANFETGDAIDVSGFFPGVEPLAVAQSIYSGQVSQDIRVTLNSQNQIVISGQRQDLIGLDLHSESGALVPIPAATTLGGFNTADAYPFDILLSNTAHQITYANVRQNYILNGTLLLSAGWDPMSAIRDVRLMYVTSESINPVAAYVDERLFDPASIPPVPVTVANRASYVSFIEIQEDDTSVDGQGVGTVQPDSTPPDTTPPVTTPPVTTPPVTTPPVTTPPVTTPPDTTPTDTTPPEPAISDPPPGPHPDVPNPDNPKETVANGAYSVQDQALGSSDPARAIAYENYSTSRQIELTSIEWSGAYAEPFPEVVSDTDFIVSIWEDSSGVPRSRSEPVLSWTFEGGVIAGQGGDDLQVTPDNSFSYHTHVGLGGGPGFDYSAKITGTLPAGKYWISVVADQSFDSAYLIFDPEWIWKVGTGTDGFYAADERRDPALTPHYGIFQAGHNLSLRVRAA